MQVFQGLAGGQKSTGHWGAGDERGRNAECRAEIEEGIGRGWLKGLSDRGEGE